MREMCGILGVGLPSRATGHYCRRMPVVRRLVAVCALALAAVALLAAPAAASAATPVEIFEDFAFNRGTIAGDYSFDDLVAALEEADGDPFYANFARAVEDKLDADYLGRSPGDGSRDLSGAADPESSGLPVPRTPDQSGDPPWPFLALAALAGALVVSGAGSSIYRRARR
jgi:hypothetical protein